MDKNTIIGFVLIAAVLFGFAYFQQPSEEQVKQQQEQIRQDSIKSAKQIEASKLAKAKQAEEIQSAKTTHQLSFIMHYKVKRTISFYRTKT